MTLELSQRNTSLTALGLPEIFQLAEVLIPTGFLPSSIKTPGQAAAIILKGQELGIPPLYALNNIAIVNGKQVCQAELMLALIFRDQGDQAVKILETSDRVCRVRYKRRGGEPGEMAFTIEEAAQAGLVAKNPTYKTYPAAMLRARAISAAARASFPDSIAGMYTPEELGARVVVNGQGEVVLDDQQPDESAPELPRMRAPAIGHVMTMDGESIRRPLTAEQHREMLMDRYAELWNQATELKLALPSRDDLPEGPPGVWSTEQLANLCREIKALIQSDRAGAAR